MIHVYLGILMMPMVWCHGTPHREASCPFGAKKGKPEDGPSFLRALPPF
jgi:hypothetical protein